MIWPKNRQRREISHGVCMSGGSSQLQNREKQGPRKKTEKRGQRNIRKWNIIESTRGRMSQGRKS